MTKASVKTSKAQLCTDGSLVFIVSRPVERKRDGFACALCNSVLKTTTTFKNHVLHVHNGSAEASNTHNLSVKRKLPASLPPVIKLPKVHSQDDVEDALARSEGSKLMTKEAAVLAAAGSLGLPTEEQQKVLLITDMLKLQPVAFNALSHYQYLLANDTTIKELVAGYPNAFHLPPQSSHSIIDLPSGVNQGLLHHLVSSSRLSAALKNETYVELNSEMTRMANMDWATNPQAKYVVSQLFAGCILLDGTNALLINSLEPYGRKTNSDPHAEQYGPNALQPTLPSHFDHYSTVCVRLNKDDNSMKLIIGTFSCNLLVTSSCSVEAEPIVEVGPSTHCFMPTHKTKIFINSVSHQQSLELMVKTQCKQLYEFDNVEQLKQVRSKFYRRETYAQCRSSSHITFGHIFQPITIWTLCNSYSTRDDVSQVKMASSIFKTIARKMIADDHPSLQKQDVIWSTELNGNVAATMKKLYKLVEQHGRVSIIGNHELDSYLKELAAQLVKPIQLENEGVKCRLQQRLFNTLQ